MAGRAAWTCLAHPAETALQSRPPLRHRIPHQKSLTNPNPLCRRIPHQKSLTNPNPLCRRIPHQRGRLDLSLLLRQLLLRGYLSPPCRRWRVGSWASLVKSHLTLHSFLSLSPRLCLLSRQFGRLPAPVLRLRRSRKPLLTPQQLRLQLICTRSDPDRSGIDARLICLALFVSSKAVGRDLAVSTCWTTNLR